MADPIRGKTIRWRYSDGPTAGTQFEHVFGTDGTVTYKMLGPKSEAAGGAPAQEVPRYEVARVSEDIYAVSYLAPSGWTLTTVLDMKAGTIVSVASNEKQLFVQRGTFEIVR
jgi:hypothetical protein